MRIKMRRGVFFALLSLVVASGVHAKSMADEKEYAVDKETVKNLPAGLEGGAEKRLIAIIAEDKRGKKGSDLSGVLETSLTSYLTKGGLKLVERSSVAKIFKEQKFQIKNMTDPKVLAKFGSVSGATHLLMATVDAADMKMKYESNPMGNNQSTGQNTYTVSVTVGVKVVDVLTGEIIVAATKRNDAKESFAARGGGFGERLLSKAVGLKERKDKVPVRSMQTKAIGKVVDDMVPELQKAFPMTGYVIAMRKKKKFAMINLGAANGVKKGRKFDIVNVSEFTDFTGRTRKKSEKIATLTVKEVGEDFAWGKLSKGKKVLLGHEAVSQAQKRSLMHKFLRQ